MEKQVYGSGKNMENLGIFPFLLLYDHPVAVRPPSQLLVDLTTIATAIGCQCVPRPHVDLGAL